MTLSRHLTGATRYKYALGGKLKSGRNVRAENRQDYNKCGIMCSVAVGLCLSMSGMKYDNV